LHPGHELSHSPSIDKCNAHRNARQVSLAGQPLRVPVVSEGRVVP
jgi:hypothetical protein